MSTKQSAIDGSVPAGARVRDVMITHPKLVDPNISIHRAEELFADEHVHMLLLVDGDTLVGTLLRADLQNRPRRGIYPATSFAVLHGRWVREDQSATDVLSQMSTRRTRRLAVIDEAQKLTGLLCLKRSGAGFCSDADVMARVLAGE